MGQHIGQSGDGNPAQAIKHRLTGALCRAEPCIEKLALRGGDACQVGTGSEALEQRGVGSLCVCWQGGTAGGKGEGEGEGGGGGCAAVASRSAFSSLVLSSMKIDLDFVCISASPVHSECSAENPLSASAHISGHCFA